MITEKIKELEATKAKLASLEQSIASQLAVELAALPAQYGYADASSFAKAVLEASGKRGPRAGKKAVAGEKKPRRKRAIITDATRAEVKRLVEAGQTGAAIAEAVGISLPSVQNIKKALGLVKGR